MFKKSGKFKSMKYLKSTAIISTKQTEIGSGLKLLNEKLPILASQEAAKLQLYQNWRSEKMPALDTRFIEFT